MSYRVSGIKYTSSAFSYFFTFRSQWISTIDPALVRLSDFANNNSSVRLIFSSPAISRRVVWMNRDCWLRIWNISCRWWPWKRSTRAASLTHNITRISWPCWLHWRRRNAKNIICSVCDMWYYTCLQVRLYAANSRLSAIIGTRRMLADNRARRWIDSYWIMEIRSDGG